MLVEKWADGHNFPRFTSDDASRRGRGASRPRCSTCARRAASSPTRTTRRRGASSRRNLDSTSATCRTITARRRSTAARCRSRTTCRCGPTCSARFAHRRPACAPRPDRYRHRRREDGRARRASISAHWPEQSYEVESRVQFPRMREHLLRRSELGPDRRRRLRRHVSSVQGRPRSGRHVQERRARLERLPVPGAVRLAALDAGRLRSPERRSAVLWRRRAVRLLDRAARRRRRGPTARFDVDYTNVDLARFTDLQSWPGLRFAGRASGHNLLEWPLGPLRRASRTTGS